MTPARWTDPDPERKIRDQLEEGRVSCLFWLCMVGGLATIALVALWPWQ